MTANQATRGIILLCLINGLFLSFTIGQNVGINSTGAAADNSALLDLDASNRGFLMTRSDTADISSPAFGLITVSPGDSCLYMYSGTKWFPLGGVGCCCGTNATPSSGTITGLDCGGATINGSLTDGSPASGVLADIGYTGGNGGSYGGQTVSSTGVTGLTAMLNAGSFANGSGILTYSIAGTPTNSGTATFELNIGGQACNLSITIAPIAIICNGVITVVNDVTSTTGAIWMDRNLGASQAATSSTDASAYGDLYQWGRWTDGHQCRTSGETTVLSGTDTPGHDDFITTSSSPYDWRSPQNNNLWQGLTGINNPCPTGYRIPTQAEWQAEDNAFSPNNSTGAFNSPLMLPLGGWRSTFGQITAVGVSGYFWSSTVNGDYARYLVFHNSSAMSSFFRSSGYSVRCLKD